MRQARRIKLVALSGSTVAVVLALAVALPVGSRAPGTAPTPSRAEPGETSGKLVVDAPAPQRGTIVRRRLVVLDGTGRTLLSGPPGGLIGAVAICPGSQHLLEVQDGPRWFSWTYLYVRRLDTLKKVRMLRLPIGDEDTSFFGTIACTERSGRRGVVFISQDTLNIDRSRLLLLRGRHVREIHRGHFSHAYLTRKTAFMISTEYAGYPHGGPRRVVAVRLRDGRDRLVTRLPWAPQSAAVSPDGKSLAVIIQPANPTDREDRRRPPKLYLFNAVTGARRGVVRLPGFPAATGIFDPGFSDRPQPARPCPPVCESGEAIWVSNRMVAFVPSVAPGKATYLFTRRGRGRGQLTGLYGEFPTLLGNRLYTIARNVTMDDPYAPPGLRVARLPDGEATQLVELTPRNNDRSTPEALVAVP